jgi:hypothetical protein
MYCNVQERCTITLRMILIIPCVMSNIKTGVYTASTFPGEYVKPVITTTKTIRKIVICRTCNVMVFPCSTSRHLRTVCFTLRIITYYVQQHILTFMYMFYYILLTKYLSVYTCMFCDNKNYKIEIPFTNLSRGVHVLCRKINLH